MAKIETKAEELVAVWEAALRSFTSEEVWATFGFTDATSLAEFARLPSSHHISRASVVNNRLAVAAARPCLWLIDILLKTYKRPADVSLAQHIANIQSATDPEAKLRDPQSSLTSSAVKVAPSLSALFGATLLLKLAQHLTIPKKDAVNLGPVREAIWKLLSRSLNNYLMLTPDDDNHQRIEHSSINLLVEMLVASARDIFSAEVRHQQQHARECLEMLKSLMIEHEASSLGIGTEMLRQGAHRFWKNAHRHDNHTKCARAEGFHCFKLSFFKLSFPLFQAHVSAPKAMSWIPAA